MARPEHESTVESRRTVESMSGYGIPQDEIAKVLEITAKTLRKHYKNEIATSHIKANSKVAETAYRMATSGTYPAMTMFWLKTRLGWREINSLEVTDPEGKPLGTGAVATLMDRLEGIAVRKALAAADDDVINATSNDGGLN